MYSMPRRNNGTIATSSRRQLKFKYFDLWVASLCLLVCLVLQIELLAYKFFVSDSDVEDSPVHGVQSVLRGGNDGLITAVSVDKQTQKDQQKLPQLPQHHKKHDTNKVLIPVKQPTPVNQPTPAKQSESSLSYEPTHSVRISRLKIARGKARRRLMFWRKFEAEKIVPPSPSTDLPPEIAYVTTLTKCGRKDRGSIDGAAVLLHSIRRNSHGWIPLQSQSSSSSVDFDPSMLPRYGGTGGRYRYKAYVIVDSSASPTIKSEEGDCARFMQSIGWTVLHRPPLVPLFPVPSDVSSTADSSATFDELVKAGYVGVQRPKTGDTARQPGERLNKLPMFLYNEGCCGDTELLKLHIYGIVGHELAVHLDFDSLILRPMDDLFDVMLGKQNDDKVASSLAIAKLPHSKPVDFSRPIDAAFTRDYNSVKHPEANSPVGYQGGFLIVRPSLAVLERYRKILQRGEFTLNPRKGWGNKHGNFYGDATFQGILPYYYEDIAPPGEHNELELDRCIYNQMADNPRKSTHRFPRATPLNPNIMGYEDTNICRDGRKDCSDTDCQRMHPKDSITAHFSKFVTQSLFVQDNMKCIFLSIEHIKRARLSQF